MEQESKNNVFNVITIMLLLIILSGVAYVSFNAGSDSLQATNIVNINTDKVDDIKININKASVKELSSLDGIGTCKAKRIISNRPYENISNLLDTLTQAQFNRVKNEVTVE